MVSGHTQAIDSAPVKANASMDSLELKVPEEDLDSHLKKIRHISAMDKEEPNRKVKENKASREQQTISANKQESAAIKSRNKKWAKDQEQEIKGVNTPVIKHIIAQQTQMLGLA